MSEDGHDIDNLFYNALETHEEAPSPHVWEVLSAGLAKENILIDKKQFIILRRIFAVAIFILAFLVIHETDFIKKGYGVAAEKIKTPGYSSKKILDSVTENKGSNSLLMINMQQQKNEPMQKNAKNNMMDTMTYKTGNNLSSENRMESSYSRDTIHSKTSTDTLDIPLIAGLLNERINIYNGQQIQTGSVAAGRQKELAAHEKNTLTNNDTSLLQPAKKSQKGKPDFLNPYWTATAFAKREWTQYNLENDVLENSQNTDDRTAIAKRENHEPSYMFGILATYRFKKHLSLETGLAYSNTAIIIEPQKVYAVKDNNGGVSYKYNTSSGYAFLKSTSVTAPALGDSLYTATAQHTLEYIGMPVLLRYNVTHKKLSLSAGIGFAVNLLTAAKIKTEIKNTTGAETVSLNRLQGIKSFYTDVLVNAGIGYKIKAKWAINIMPSYRYALSPINKNNVVKTFPYSLGLGLGVTYKF